MKKIPLLELSRVTESAAVGVMLHVGGGDKLAIDRVATEAMRRQLAEIRFSAVVAVGEGVKDRAPGLEAGERVGSGLAASPDFDIAVDPVEGTTQVAQGGRDAVSVLAVGQAGSLLATDVFYMSKIAVGPRVAKFYRPSLGADLRTHVQQISSLLSRPITVAVLNRPRHADAVAQLRECGCSVILFPDCDVPWALATALTDKVDLLVGVGGAPEGVIMAAAMKCVGGHFEGQLVSDDGYEPVAPAMSMDELAAGEVAVSVTGVTDGIILAGPRYYHEGGVVTETLLMHSRDRSVRRIRTHHQEL